jgi:two-component system phosphate regulon sensor histidine kinase PhoR
MTRKRRWIWVLLFVIVVLLVGGLAAGWNVVLVSQYSEALEAAKRLSIPRPRTDAPWIPLTLGSVGFALVVGGLALFFVRLLQEMRLNQLQSEFLAAVSHELKTPIATLELTSSLLRSGESPPEEAERLWRGHDAELKRLREEVETLLEAARWQSGSARTQAQRVDLESWLREAMERWRTMLGPRAELAREGEPLDGPVLLDPKAMSLITDNLIDNARKFSRENPRVVIRSRRRRRGRRQYWELAIRDSGWGFEPGDSQRIFRRFFRSRPNAPYAIPGTGLGLFLAATASRAQRIRIRGESAGRGHGATFTLSGAYQRGPHAR